MFLPGSASVPGWWSRATITQVDLPAGQASGLRLVQEILEGVEDIQFTRLTSHGRGPQPASRGHVNAYEAYEARTGMGRPGAGRQPAGPGAAERGDGRGRLAGTPQCGPVTGPGA